MRNFWEWIKKSLTVKGVVTAAVGVVCDPNVLGILPPSAARTVAVIGAACTVLGLRRALPAPPGGAASGPAAAPLAGTTLLIPDGAAAAPKNANGAQ